MAVAGIIAALPTIAKVVTAVIELIKGFAGIGGGCGEACIGATQAQETFDVAMRDLVYVANARMVAGVDAAALIRAMEQGAETAFLPLIQQLGQPAQGGLNEVLTALPRYEQLAQQNGPATEPLDISKAQALFLPITTPGWYEVSVIAGNNLATQILQEYLAGAASASENETVSGSISTIISGIGSALAAGQNATSSAWSNIIGGLGGLASGLKDVSQSSTSTILSGILGVVGVSATASASIANDISSALGDIQKAVSFVNSDVIGKVIDPILKTVSQQNQLVVSIDADLKNGLTGILQIPSVLAGAFTSQAQASRQAVLLGNENRTSVATSITVPGIGGAISGSVAAMHETIQGLTGIKAEQIPGFSPITTFESLKQTQATQMFEGAAAPILNAKGPINDLFRGLFSCLMAVESLAASAEPLLEFAVQNANLVNPVKTLDPQTAVQAMYRGVIKDTAAAEEAGRQGINPERFQALTDTLRPLLDAGDAIAAYFRGTLDQATMARELTDRGWTPARIEALVDVRRFLPDPATASDWVARDYITPEIFSAYLLKLGWQQTEIDIFAQTLYRPPDLGDYARFQARLKAAAKGFLSASYQQTAPPDVAGIGKQNRLSTAMSDLAWLGHWRDLDPDVYLNAMFRGLIEPGFLNEALDSMNYPAEIHDVFVEAQRPLIPYFYITEILSAGVMTEQQARDTLAKYGFSQADIETSIRFGTFKNLGKATDQANGLSQLAVAQLTTLLTDGVIGSQQYTLALEAHGYDTATAALLTEIEQIKLAGAAQKEYVKGLEDEVKAGLVTRQAALDQLASHGFTEAQTAAFINDIRSATAAKSKLPTEIDLIKMAKDGIIAYADWSAAMQLLGYYEPWIGRIAQLEGIPNG